MLNKVLIFPTDTVYGIGASIYDRASQRKIYEIKHRPLDKPLAILCANISQIKDIAFIDDEASKLINKFLPGPLTLIVEAKPEISKILGLKKIGVRIPKYDVALKVLTQNGPMATTSVNESGAPSINDYLTIKDEYSKVVDEIYAPSQDITSSCASTVVDITDGIRILREGEITLSQIEEALK